jgi:hypothetical protein
MEGTAAFEAPQITEFGGNQRSSDRTEARNDARGAFNRVFHPRKEPLYMDVESGELFFEDSSCAIIADGLNAEEKRAERTYVPKKQAGQQDLISDYLFGNFLQRSAFRSTYPAPGPCRQNLAAS